jgi:hypothetical protein
MHAVNATAALQRLQAFKVTAALCMAAAAAVAALCDTANPITASDINGCQAAPLRQMAVRASDRQLQ